MLIPPNNLKEFKALERRYETITLDEIIEAWEEGHTTDVANQLTGFGTNSCTLCTSAYNRLCVSESEILNKCDFCVWGITTKLQHQKVDSVENFATVACTLGINKKTYQRLKTSKSDTPEKLLLAFRKRAKRMRRMMKLLEKILKYTGK